MDGIWTAIGAISGAATVVLVVLATVYASHAVREAARSRTASVLLQFQTWHESDRARTARRRLFGGELSDLARLSADDRSQLEEVVDQHEFLAMLVARKLLDERAAMTFYRYSPALVWDHAKGFVLDMRRTVPHYGGYLQAFAERARAKSTGTR